MKKMTSALILIGLLVLSVPFTTDAQGQDNDQAALAETVQNPISNMVSLPFQYNYNGGFGEYDRKSLNLNIQPVIPFPGENWNVITRTIISLNSVPIGENGADFGFGDINVSTWLSPAEPAALSWGLGGIVYLPTSSNPEVLGSGKLSIGPSGVLFYGIGKFTMGGVASQAWSVAGDDDRQEFNSFFAQWFINYNIGGGWAIGTAPIVTANWMASDDDIWTVPWGLQLSKVTHLGTRPANLLIGYYYNSKHPTDGAEYQVRMQVNLLFP